MSLCGVGSMNRRIRKKRAKKYCVKGYLGSWQCSKCGWDSLADLSHSEIVWVSSDGEDWQVHCKCPVCGNKFDYFDGV